MGLFGSIMDSMRINPDPEDDEFYEDEEEDYVDSEPRTGLFRKKNRDDEYESESEGKSGIFQRNKTVPGSGRRNMEVTMVKPTAVEDARTITTLLLSGKAVILNMEGIPTDLAQRIIDFTSGATFSMDGKLQKISSFIFMATPSSVDLSGEFQDMLNSGQLDFGSGSLRY